MDKDQLAADLAKAAELHMPAMVVMVHQLRSVYDHAAVLEARATAAEAENARLREALRKIDQMSGSHEAWGHVARATLQGNQVERFSRWLQNTGHDGA